MCPGGAHPWLFKKQVLKCTDAVPAASATSACETKSCRAWALPVAFALFHGTTLATRFRRSLNRPYPKTYKHQIICCTLAHNPWTLAVLRPSAFVAPHLGGSWAVIRGVVSPLIRVISVITLLITLLIATHEPPSSLCRILVL